MARKLIALLTVGVMLALALPALAVVPISGTESTPVSSGGITPYIIPGYSGPQSQGGNRTCADVGIAFFDNAAYYEFSSARVNYNGSFDAPFPAGLTVTTDGTYVSFNSTFGIGAVIVKGGNDANVYVYEPQRKSDSGLASPPTGSGNPAGLSNITFCWNPEPEMGQWCSPGYWRQEHHLDSWEATGYSPNELFYDVFGYYPPLSKKGVTDGATTDPTLWQVLQAPQYYGGDAFNAIGDLLSAAHPDVNFTGERVEDSCPLD